MSEALSERLQEVLAALLARRLELSLTQVERALASWRAGETDATTAHTETLRHAGRASTLGARIARAGLEGPASLLRDAYDLDIIDAAEFETLAGVPLASVPAAPPLDEEAAATGPGQVSRMPRKRDVVMKLLEDGPVLVHLDARKPEVSVPEQHRTDPKLVLRLGQGLSPAIPDLDIGESGVRATLSFRGKPHTCQIPWDAVYAVVAEDGRGLVWPEHVPAEVEAEFNRGGPREERRARRRPNTEPPPDKSPPRGRGHLRLV
jgi:stringent starvation protein B